MCESFLTSYLLKRLILTIPTFIFSTLVIFFITRLVPGGPLDQAIANYQNQMMMGSESDQMTSIGSTNDRSSSSLSDEQLQQLKEFYGLDKPILVSYIELLGRLIRLDFGESTRFYIPVWDLIKQKLPISTYYGIMTFFITYLVCIPLGIAKALKHKSLFDSYTSIFTFLGYAVPSYIVAILSMVFLGARLEWFPMGGFMSENTYGMSKFQIAIDIIYHSILPLIAYLIGSFAVLTYSMKNLLLENLSKDYIKTAVAKGVSYKKAVINHALRNSIIPLASGFSSLLTVFLSGSYLIEVIFNIDGLGLFGYESLINRDYPVIIATFAVSFFIGIIGSIITDFIVAIIDPRVSYD